MAMEQTLADVIVTWGMIGVLLAVGAGLWNLIAIFLEPKTAEGIKKVQTNLGEIKKILWGEEKDKGLEKKEKAEEAAAEKAEAAAEQLGAAELTAENAAAQGTERLEQLGAAEQGIANQRRALETQAAAHAQRILALEAKRDSNTATEADLTALRQELAAFHQVMDQIFNLTAQEQHLVDKGDIPTNSAVSAATKQASSEIATGIQEEGIASAEEAQEIKDDEVMRQDIEQEKKEIATELRNNADPNEKGRLTEIGQLKFRQAALVLERENITRQRKELTDHIIAELKAQASKLSESDKIQVSHIALSKKINEELIALNELAKIAEEASPESKVLRLNQHMRKNIEIDRLQAEKRQIEHDLGIVNAKTRAIGRYIEEMRIKRHPLTGEIKRLTAEIEQIERNLESLEKGVLVSEERKAAESKSIKK